MPLTRRQTLASFLLAGATPAMADAAPSGRLTLVHINDVYRIEEDENARGGFARLAAVVKRERARAARDGRTMIFAHAGDTLSPSLMSGLDQGAHMIELFNTLGLDVFVPGNHEFDFGTAVYRQRVGEAAFAFLAANMRTTQGASLPRHEDRMMLPVGSLKVALVGAAYDKSASLSHPDDLVFTPSFETIRDGAKAARAAGADFVVAIVHADKPAGMAIMNAHVAEVVLSGHNHDLHIDFDGRTAFAESGQDADFVTVIDIDLREKVGEDGKRFIAWWPIIRIEDTALVVPDPDMATKVEAFQTSLAQTLDLALATLAAPLDSRTSIVRSEESAIGDLFTDAIRQATKADVAILNGGGFRGNRTYPRGAVLTRRDVLGELPFGNKTILSDVTGAQVKAALENGLSQLERPAGRFPQVSGLVVVADRAAPVGARVKALSIGGQPLDPARVYKVATNDFMARGGDGYAMLAGRMRVTADSGQVLVAQDVMDYAADLKTIAVKPEGRVVLE